MEQSKLKLVSEEGKKVHVDDIVDFLVQATAIMLEHKVGVAMGYDPESGHERYNSEAQDFIINLVKPMILSSQQAREMDATSANQVVKLLAKGKLKPIEAQLMLKLLKQKLELKEEEQKTKIKNQILKELDKIGDK